MLNYQDLNVGVSFPDSHNKVNGYRRDSPYEAALCGTTLEVSQVDSFTRVGEFNIMLRSIVKRDLHKSRYVKGNVIKRRGH